MDIDDEDDFYAPEEPTIHSAESASAAAANANTNDAPTEPQQDEDLEEGEEEDEGAEMEDSDSVRCYDSRLLLTLAMSTNLNLRT
jgi:pre-mRNA 3'-end-processing factor FIP1